VAPISALEWTEKARRITVQFFVTIDRDEDGMWIVECPSIPGCVSQGETRDEALENLKEAISLCLEVREEKGLPLTIETAQLEVSAGCQNYRL
jgi:predicted RNase H-like HicB family nuclease